MASITTEKLFNDLQLASRGSYDRNAMDIQDHVLYDCNNYAATSVRPATTFFNQPLGAPYMGGTKTLTETNMTLQGQIPNSQYMIVNEISFSLLSGIVGTDIDQNTVVSAYTNILQNSNIRLVLAGRSFDLELPGTVFFPPVFAHALNSAANGGDVGYHTASGWMSLKLPIVIEGGAAFNVVMTTGAASATIQTLLNTASDALATQNAQISVRLKGTLIRYK